MNGNLGDTKRESIPAIGSNTKRDERKIAQDRTASVGRFTAMPNPVKGLRLSLYPMVKEH